MASEIFQN